MKTIFRYFLLFIPLFFLGLTWLGVVFGIDPIPDGFLRDDTYEYSGDGQKESGLISLSLVNTITFIAIGPGSIICLIYTAYKKLWWWFTAYMILAGFPISIFMFG
ncbi:hypothetical protein AB4538_24460 [Vibrio lentus]